MFICDSMNFIHKNCNIILHKNSKVNLIKVEYEFRTLKKFKSSIAAYQGLSCSKVEVIEIAS